METIDLTAQIVSAYLAGNGLGKIKMPDLIRLVHAALISPTSPNQQPAVPVQESIFPDYLVCLEDGMCMRLLKLHLLTAHDMTPSQYRAKWELPPDYPMIAPGYAKQRSTIAKDTGLGKSR